MLSIEEILAKEPYASFEEIQEIKRYIQKTIFEPGIVDKESLGQAQYWCPAKKNINYSDTDRYMLFWDFFHILFYGFIQKKINKQPYSLNSFKEGLSVIAQVNSKANLYLKNNVAHDFNKWLNSRTQKALENKDQAHKEIPAKDVVLWAICNNLKRYNYRWKGDFQITSFNQEDYFIEDFTTAAESIKKNLPNYIDYSSYKRFFFRKTFPDNAYISGEVFLLLDKSNDGKAIIFESINIKSPWIIDLIFKMFFYAYLHNRKFLTKIKLQNKIEKFGFLYPSMNLNGNVSNIFEHKLHKELTKLFNQLYKKIKKEDLSPPTIAKKACDWWKKNLQSVCLVVTSIGTIVGLFWR